MGFSEAQVQKAAREMVAGLRMAHEQEVMEEAIGWTIVCHDLELGTFTVHGVYGKEELAQAMWAAVEWQQELNIAATDPEVDGYRCDVMVLNQRVKE